VTLQADRRLALLAMAKFAGVSVLLGLILGVGMTLDGQSPWFIPGLPVALGVLCAATLGSAAALTWYLLPGRVTYAFDDGFLVARRGNWTRKRVPAERIAGLEFDQKVAWTDLMFTGWFGYVSPIPALSVRLTQTSDRWNPTNGAVEHFPALLIAGRRQEEALRQLRQALSLTLDQRPG
jgi:hypothetical protein